MLSSAGCHSPALHVDGRKSSDDRPSCLENPRPGGAESTLTENVASPFHAEPRQTGTKLETADTAKGYLQPVGTPLLGEAPTLSEMFEQLAKTIILALN